MMSSQSQPWPLAGNDHAASGPCHQPQLPRRAALLEEGDEKFASLRWLVWPNDCLTKGLRNECFLFWGVGERMDGGEGGA